MTPRVAREPVVEWRPVERMVHSSLTADVAQQAALGAAACPDELAPEIVAV